MQATKSVKQEDVQVQIIKEDGKAYKVQARELKKGDIFRIHSGGGWLIVQDDEPFAFLPKYKAAPISDTAKIIPKIRVQPETQDTVRIIPKPSNDVQALAQKYGF